MRPFRRRNEETMDGEVIDLAAMEGRSRRARRKRLETSEYEYLVEQQSVIRMPIDAPSTAHPSVWAQTHRKLEPPVSESAVWREVVEVLSELRAQIEGYRQERRAFEAWADEQRAAIEEERRALRAEARALAEDVGTDNERA
jgi:hypothetical protein